MTECACVCLCIYSWSRLIVLFVVAVDGHTAMVRDWPRHGSHSRDDACCWVITEDGVCGLTVFPSAAKDEDLAVAHWHATALLQEGRERNQWRQLYTNPAFLGDQTKQSLFLVQQVCVIYYLFAEGVDHMHPVILCGVIAEYGLGETTAHIDQVVEGHCCDTALGDGDAGLEHPTICLWIIALNLWHIVEVVGCGKTKGPIIYKNKWQNLMRMTHFTETSFICTTWWKYVLCSLFCGLILADLYFILSGCASMSCIFSPLVLPNNIPFLAVFPRCNHRGYSVMNNTCTSIYSNQQGPLGSM